MIKHTNALKHDPPCSCTVLVHPCPQCLRCTHSCIKTLSPLAAAPAKYVAPLPAVPEVYTLISHVNEDLLAAYACCRQLMPQIEPEAKIEVKVRCLHSVVCKLLPMDTCSAHYFLFFCKHGLGWEALVAHMHASILFQGCVTHPSMVIYDSYTTWLQDSTHTQTRLRTRTYSYTHSIAHVHALLHIKSTHLSIYKHSF